MKFLRIKNWKRFQHFKDRSPPWVKLYRDLLDDREWFELDPAAAKVMVMLWLIASEDGGALPDIKTLAFRLRITIKQTESAVTNLSHWLEHDDIGVISEGYHGDIPERETETEREGETEGEREAASPPSPPAPARVKATRQVFAPPEKQEIIDWLIDSGKATEYIKAGWTDVEIGGELGKFLEYYGAKGWKIGNSPMKDWRLAFQKWIRVSTEYTNQRPAPRAGWSNR